ncbi:hypothetical protein SBD_1344 [Streptomyces bottropensis ATCC 25435]|uniref:Uncharacterized protein n=1 Tax=Streptomyces bottropensis ATCC 25435 TaxID=1054862 RepID=M3FW20_9ACTN|nr:hypothetical protein SBD_1344 [Streptomyces bottropensis ATCC 25435]
MTSAKQGGAGASRGAENRASNHEPTRTDPRPQAPPVRHGLPQAAALTYG